MIAYTLSHGARVKLGLLCRNLTLHAHAQVSNQPILVKANQLAHIVLLLYFTDTQHTSRAAMREFVRTVNSSYSPCAVLS